jgi:peptidoglycan/LPS O-acetylase OafA/YrhL
MNKFLPGIHGLRAIAALSVLLFHQAPNLSVPEFAGFIKNYGGFGVQLFFALSAFALAHSTHDRMQKAGWVRSFALRRFFRIAPLFYTAIVCFLVYDYLVWGKIHTLSEIMLNVFFLHGFVPGIHESIVWAGWTIGVEMIFYAVFPVILSMLGSARGAAIFFLLSCVASASIVAEFSTIPALSKTYPYMNIIRSLPSFAAGLCAFYGYEFLIRKELRPIIIQASCAAVTLGLGYLAVKSPLAPFIPSEFIWSALFGVLCVWQSAAPGLIIASKPMQFVGERSYSVYLVHAMIVFRLAPVYGSIYAAMPSSMSTLAYGVCVALGLTCVLVIANITYTFIEAPGMKFGSSLARFREKAHTNAFAKERSTCGLATRAPQTAT